MLIFNSFSLVSTITGCIFISALASLVCVPVDIIISSAVLKISANTPGIKRYKSIVTNKEKLDRKVLLGKDKLNTIEMLTAF